VCLYSSFVSIHMHHLYVPFPLHDALPISLDDEELISLFAFAKNDAAGPDQARFDTVARQKAEACICHSKSLSAVLLKQMRENERKSTRLNSSHVSISYAVFCLKKKKIKTA